ncbi:hypothetical protein [Schnuerera sp.]|uniref:hypothetical protein n=1 Tax=Schnuerera sp. TaxID=2794844 RepID=UPI002BE867E3|nr:hypothetical protein [Schnuerera sp.]HSH34964.1 hypothetical protein [Schnuerera sp.]
MSKKEEKGERYIEQFDDYSYIIAPKAFPYVIKDVDLYEGDEISISIKGIHLDDENTPFNFDIFDSFEAEFRLHSRHPIAYPALPDNFVLGQSEEAIQYDIDQGNPANTTMDELHFIDPDYSILQNYRWPIAELDIQGLLSDSIYTFMRFEIEIEKDITN